MTPQKQLLLSVIVLTAGTALAITTKHFNRQKNNTPSQAKAVEQPAKKTAAATKQEASASASVSQAISTQAPVPASVSQATTGVQKRSVTVANDISDEKTAYHKIVTYHPTLFKLMVNGKDIQQDNSAPVDVANNELTIVYYCEFKDGKRKSSKEYLYKVDPSAKNVAITFDWHEDPRIMVTNAKFVKMTPIDVE